MDLSNSNSLPLFSIIIANYNNGKYLLGCIESIKNQTYVNWEIILVDDFSTDNSHELYKNIKNNKQIKILYNDTNKGVGYTKKRAVDNSLGKYIGIVDPDDKITPETLEIVVNKFEINKDIALVYTNHHICDENLKIIKSSTNSGQIPKGESQLSYNGPKVGPFWAFEKSVYDQTEGFDSSFRAAEDQDLYYKLEEVGKIIFINKPCYFYRYHNNGISTTNNFFKAYLFNLRAMKIANKRRKKNNSTVKCLSKKDLASRWLFYYQGYSLYLLEKKHKAKVTILLLKSFRFIIFDKQLLSLKILLKYIVFRKAIPKQ